eukprot:3384226-Pleurochrysis_carterae.AAC.2
MFLRSSSLPFRPVRSFFLLPPPSCPAGLPACLPSPVSASLTACPLPSVLSISPPFSLRVAPFLAPSFPDLLQRALLRLAILPRSPSPRLAILTRQLSLFLPSTHLHKRGLYLSPPDPILLLLLPPPLFPSEYHPAPPAQTHAGRHKPVGLHHRPSSLPRPNFHAGGLNYLI